MRATIMPPIKKHTRATNPLTANWSEPLSPWPLGQPSARRAPNIAITPPMKATKPRLIRLGPNLDSHISGTAFHRKLPDVIAAMNDPIKIPTTNIHCQSIMGNSLMKYSILATRSGSNSFSIMPDERTKVVDAPKYFPAIHIDKMDTIPLNAPAK